MQKTSKTVVTNLMDDRTLTFDLPADRAVVAAFEQSEAGNMNENRYPKPEEHPAFKEYRLGFACGDWIAFKPREDHLAA